MAAAQSCVAEPRQQLAENDPESESHTITEVTEGEDAWNLTLEPGWGFALSKEYAVTPKVGDRCTQWGKGLGYPIRGVAIGDNLLYYLSEEEQELSHRAWKLDYQARRIREFLAKKDEMDATFAALPEAFQKRIARFREESEDFRWESEDYEVFCCTEAVKIAEALETPEAVSGFMSKSYEEQQKLVEGLGDGHSGNTFGGACRLAYAYLRGEDL